MNNNEINIIRDTPIKVKNTTIPREPVPVDELREIYLNKVEIFVNKLKHSVCKNYENPSYEGFRSEITHQKMISDQIFFLQSCRAAIEQAVEEGRGEAVGVRTTATFIRTEDGLIQAITTEK